MLSDTIPIQDLSYGKQLTNLDMLSIEQHLQIATLIYETDPYIYPALFKDEDDTVAPEDNAAKILPSIFENGRDSMFCKDNLYVYCRGSDILGIILWNKGSLQWDYQSFFYEAKSLGVNLKWENIKAVEEGYVTSQYAKNQAEMQNTINLINICVDSRLRGQGIGRKMMQAFTDEHVDEPMILCVLAKNHHAIKLYENMGFRIVQELPGFSLDEEKPKCYDMSKEKTI